MPQPERARVKALFEAVCDQPQAARSRYLDLAVGADKTLRAEVESLLAFDSETVDAFDDGQIKRASSAAGSGHIEMNDDGPHPEKIGAYRIIRLIGVGGMGVVYEAEQASPFRRVALKVMRRGRDSRLLARRFEREGAIQARLNHPAIATVYETGIDAATGTAFVAMELVEGEPLRTFVHAHALEMTARLRLAAELCDAVSAAHQRGVVHRDLKPDNILVRMVDGRAQPKILDFGVAKLTDHDLQAMTMQTEAGQLIGTLAYMSPEQLRGRADEIDTRTDIYALGVILFEMLAGRGCYEIKDLPLVEAVRRMSEHEPARLGTLVPDLRGDVETIVHKAIDRDIRHRYATASELAADIRRYLNHEPIQARPTTVLYQVTRFARRHRPLVAAVVVIALMLVAGVVMASYLAIKAERSRKIAESKTAVAEGVSNVLLGAFTVATPKGTQGREPLLLDAIRRIESSVNDGTRETIPEVRAVVLNIAGIVHRERGDYEQAEKNFTQALEIRRKVLAPNDPNLADSLNNMGLLRKRQERFAEAATYYQQAVDVQRRSAFQDDARLARNIYNLASAYISAGEVEKAKPILAESLELHRRLPQDNPEVIGYHISAQARIAQAEGNWPEAQKLAEEALTIQREAVGPAHPSIIAALNDLAAVEQRRGHHERAIILLQESYRVSQEVFASQPTHPTLTLTKRLLSDALLAAGRDAEAEHLNQPED